MNLYEIRSEIDSIMAQTNDDGMLPDDAFDRLAELGIAEADKIENLGLLLKNMAAESAAIKAEVDNLNKRRKVLDNRTASIEAYLTAYLQATGSRVKTARLQLSLRPSVAVVIDDESLVPDKYLIAQEPKISKTAIRDDLDRGLDVAWAHLETRQNLQVR